MLKCRLDCDATTLCASLDNPMSILVGPCRHFECPPSSMVSRPGPFGWPPASLDTTWQAAWAGRCSGTSQPLSGRHQCELAAPNSGSPGWGHCMVRVNVHRTPISMVGCMSNRWASLFPTCGGERTIAARLKAA